MSLPDFSTQGELFSTAGFSAELFGEADRYRLFARLVYPRLAGARARLEKCYCLENGRVALEPVLMLGVSLLQDLDGMPDRQAVEMLRYHAGWNFALNRQLGDPVFHPSSLANFRTRLVEHEQSALGFKTILDALQEAGLLSRQSRQRLDSTQMFARVARMSRLDTVRETLRLSLKELEAALSPQARPSFWLGLWEGYVESQTDYRSSSETLARKLVEAGTDAWQLLQWLREPGQSALAAGPQAQLLARVFGEQFQVLAGTPAPLGQEKTAVPPSDPPKASEVAEAVAPAQSAPCGPDPNQLPLPGSEAVAQAKAQEPTGAQVEPPPPPASGAPSMETPLVGQPACEQPPGPVAGSGALIPGSEAASQTRAQEPTGAQVEPAFPPASSAPSVETPVAGQLADGPPAGPAASSGALIQPKAKEQLASDRVQNPHDPDATYAAKGEGKKKKEHVGYKIQVAESVCEEALAPGEPTRNFITGILTHPAYQSDEAGALEMEKEQGAMGLEKPPVQYVDAAYVSAQELARAQSEGRELIGPAPPAPHKEGRFSVGDFQIRVEERQATCPAGKVSTQCSRLVEQATGKVSYRFEFSTQCHNCPLRAQCLGSEQRHRTIQVGEHHSALQARRQEQQTPAFKDRMKHRNAIEGTQSELVRAHGLRRARSRGLPKVKLQNYFSGAACNVKRWIRREAWKIQQAAASLLAQEPAVAAN